MTNRVPTTIPVVALLLAGLVAGGGLGMAAATRIKAPLPYPVDHPYEAPDVCAMPLDPDGIGFQILLDEARRRPYMYA